MNDGDIWKVHRTFAVRHLKSLGLGKRRVDEMIYEEYEKIVHRLLNVTTKSVAPAPYIQSGAMNVLWDLTVGSKFEDPELLMLMTKRSAAFDMAGGLLNQVPWIRYLAPISSGYSLIMDINKRLYSLIFVRHFIVIFWFI